MLGRKQHVRLQFVESRALGVGGHQHVVDERDVDAPRAQLVRELVLCGLANRELDLGKDEAVEDLPNGFRLAGGGMSLSRIVSGLELVTAETKKS